MDDNVAKFLKKIEFLLAKVVEGQCKKHTEENLDELLTVFERQKRKEIESAVILLPVFTKWLENAAVSWNSLGITPSTKICAFTLNLVSLLVKDEETFCVFNKKFFLKLFKILKVRRAGVAPCVKLGHIKVLLSFLRHQSGVKWIMASNYWQDIYQLSLSTQNEDIIKESTKFVAEFLDKTAKIDEDFADGAVKRIMLPLGENIYKSIQESNDVTEEVSSKYLKPSLRLIADILEYFLDGILFEEKNFQVVILFLKNFHLEERISDFLIISESKSLSFDLRKIMFIMHFLELCVKMITNSVSIAFVSTTITKMKQNFLLSITKCTFEDTIKLCSFAQLFWKVVEKNIPQIITKQCQNECLAFANELFLFQIMPYFCIPLKYCYEKYDMEEVLEEEFRDVFINKLFKMSCQDVVRALYHRRDDLLLREDLFQVTMFCTRSVIQVKKYITRDAAVLAVQSLIYNIKDTVHFSKEYPQKLRYFVKQQTFLAQILQLLTSLIEEFEVTWKDSIESIDLLAYAFEFLVLYNWPPDIIVLVLKLVKTAVGKYMAPNLALLLESTDSDVTVLGPLLFGKLYDDVVEVKGAALEVIRTLARISSSKFPSLQKVLMDSELPTLVVKMSTCDGESFVRATAIKCLQEMIQVEEIWNNALKTEDLPQKMRDILLNEAEGIVRVEAATFMCVAYEYQQFAKENLDRIYETMIYSSTTDLHWEVKVRALNFWDKVIKNHLQNQGMIDDSFPNVTFSKEHRKIVTLTDSEIRKRLLKVLGQLSSIGCLGVLMSAIKDDCDMEVSKTAVKITQRLIDLFKKYNVRSDSSTPNSPALTENGMSAAVSLSSGISVDESMDSPASSSNHPEVNEEIIDQIVNSKDVSLLKSVYTPSDYGSVSNYDIQVRKVVTPNEFLQFCQQDLNSLIAEKKNWLNGIEDLGSLLDDMLKSYEDDVNNMDCY